MIAHLRSLVLLSVALLSVACTQNSSPASPPVDRHSVSFVIRPATATEGGLALDLGLRNEGDPIPADETFNGVWQLTHEGEARASGIVHQLQSLPTGETIIMQWEGRLEPGRYQLVWGAPDYGYSEASFAVTQSEAGILHIGELSATSFSTDPPVEVMRLLEEAE